MQWIFASYITVSSVLKSWHHPSWHIFEMSSTLSTVSFTLQEKRRVEAQSELWSRSKLEAGLKEKSKRSCQNEEGPHRGPDGAGYHVRVTETGLPYASLRGDLFGEGQGEMTGSGGADAVVAVLVRLPPGREDGGAGEEVGAGPRHAGFLFLAHSADLEFTRGDDSRFKKRSFSLSFVLHTEELSESFSDNVHYFLHSTNSTSLHRCKHMLYILRRERRSEDLHPGPLLL